MTVKIHKILKSDLSVTNTINATNAGLSKTMGMTISHFASSVKSTEATIPFTIEGVDEHIPYIDEVEFCVVIRKKVDLKATGANSIEQKDIGKDVGKYGYKDNVPQKSYDLPPGFQELYKND